MSREPRNAAKVIRMRTWEEFKAKAIDNRANRVVYNVEQGLKRRHLTSLRLILPLEGVQCVFLDFAKEGRLKQTGIPLQTHETGVQYIREEDVIRFLKSELKNPSLRTSSFWTM